MTKPQNVEAIEKATNKSWQEWLTWLNSMGAEKLNHTRIAELVYTNLSGGKIDSPSWWAQGITVAYEQSIGRRMPGQKGNGTFEVSVSKTFEGQREGVFVQCLNLLNGAQEFNSEIAKNARTNTTPVRSYWRCELAGGGKVTWAVEQKLPNKVWLVINHTNLATAEEAAKWKVFWKKYTEKLQL